ncbi:MAG TPA: Ni/Fe hydrogenase subunit alpha [bacterium]|nr:Ni/Fe hydrogenase subunit alpha [bacterium]HQP99991.1 Ni/Fe hydrogenase subunit alpha [bacterium]
MTETITIQPVTRIEGHAKITVHLDERGEVAFSRFHVVEFRGFEKFCEGRYFAELPEITSRICGICPVSHILASAKACDAIIGVELSPTAKLLRELMHTGQITQSHALSFFHLSSPDMLIGFDADPAVRNIMGMIAQVPDIARKGIRLRRYGQEVIRHVGGRRIHAESAVPGGMNRALSESARKELLQELPEAFENIQLGMDVLYRYLDAHPDETRDFARFDTRYLGLVRPDGKLEHYDGKFRFVHSDRKILHDQIPCENYLKYIGEVSEGWSYLKFPFLKEIGYPGGIYRVGPLARLNVADGISTPKANAALQAWRERYPGGESSSFHYHAARLIEILYALERIEQILDDPHVTGTDVCEPGHVRNHQGIGVIEAPRGTLIHHYWVDSKGCVEKVNLIVSTGHNNLAMNKAVTEVAKRYVKSKSLQEGMLNRVEAAIRCYDPCLSCSTHAFGQMPLGIELISHDGCVLDRLERRGL